MMRSLRQLSVAILFSALLSAGSVMADTAPVTSGEIFTSFGYVPTFVPDFIPGAPNTGITFTPPTSAASTDGSFIEIFGGTGLPDAQLPMDIQISPPVSSYFEVTSGANTSSERASRLNCIPEASSTLMLLVPTFCLVALVHSQRKKAGRA